MSAVLGRGSNGRSTAAGFSSGGEWSMDNGDPPSCACYSLSKRARTWPSPDNPFDGSPHLPHTKYRSEWEGSGSAPGILRRW